jgi:hypothetical protein
MKSGWEYGELCRSQRRSILLLTTWSLCPLTPLKWSPGPCIPLSGQSVPHRKPRFARNKTSAKIAGVLDSASTSASRQLEKKGSEAAAQADWWRARRPERHGEARAGGLGVWMCSSSISRPLGCLVGPGRSGDGARGKRLPRRDRPLTPVRVFPRPFRLTGRRTRRAAHAD